MSKMRLPSGVRRKLYVDRKRAACLLPPLVVEDPDSRAIYARRVEFIDTPREPHHTVLDWSGDNFHAPAAWVETEAELELTL